MPAEFRPRLNPGYIQKWTFRAYKKEPDLVPGKLQSAQAVKPMGAPAEHRFEGKVLLLQHQLQSQRLGTIRSLDVQRLWNYFSRQGQRNLICVDKLRKLGSKIRVEKRCFPGPIRACDYRYFRHALVTYFPTEGLRFGILTAASTSVSEVIGPKRNRVGLPRKSFFNPNGVR